MRHWRKRQVTDSTAEFIGFLTGAKRAIIGPRAFCSTLLRVRILWDGASNNCG
jgi:molybdenum cofactor biosynthesis enzyme MoaA